MNLLPCPFCGSPAEFEYTPWHEENGVDYGEDGSGWVECTGCHIQVPCYHADEAEERWNRRITVTLPDRSDHGNR